MLSDYSSESIDLGTPRSFRPLWRPVGALDANRLASAHARRRELLSAASDEPEDEPLYHTHYSSPAYVAYYLFRLCPELTVHVQSGAFDQSSRTFGSVEECWHNVSKRSTGDVKELIPQFYSDASFLTRSQSVASCGPIALPPWAHGSGEEFVQIMRAALESDYVSAHLHLWIDLIFGSKQSGHAALAAENLFHAYTYELQAYPHLVGDDAAKRELVLTFASQVGQTPPQLFGSPHPPKRVASVRSLLAREEAATTRIQTIARRWVAQRRLSSLRQQRVMQWAQVIAQAVSTPPPSNLREVAHESVEPHVQSSDGGDQPIDVITLPRVGRSRLSQKMARARAASLAQRQSSSPSTCRAVDEGEGERSSPRSAPPSARKSRLSERLARARVGGRHQSGGGGGETAEDVGGDDAVRLAPLDWGLTLSTPTSSTC